MMQPSLFLRITAVITLLLGIGHTMGRPWVPSGDPLTLAVTTAMKSHQMHVMGFERTMMDFYVGFGMTITAHLLLQARHSQSAAEAPRDVPRLLARRQAQHVRVTPARQHNR